MNVVIYPRYSSDKQNETSIEAQQKECYSFCERNGYTIVGEYIDRATSAKTDDRPEFQRMIEDSSKGLFEAIVVYQLDRFARNRYDSAIYKTKLKKNGVRVLSVKENISDDASGILIESVLEGMAEYYSAELGQKVQRNMKLNAEKGLFNGGYSPFGYKVVSVDYGEYIKKRLEIDPDTAPVVREIFEMRANDTKVMDIVDYLNSKGYKTIQGKEFQKTSLQRIFRNKRYIGTSIYNDMEFPNKIPAIIDKELFDKVQVLVDKVQVLVDKYKYAPAIGKAKEQYILTTKLYCGKCKTAMTGTCGTSGTGLVYSYYTCNNIKRKKCNKKNVRKETIEDLVINKCREILTDKNINEIANNVYEICQKENSQNCIIKALEKEIKSLEKKIENLIIALENGKNVDIINARLTQNRVELEKAKSQLSSERTKLVNLTMDQIKFFLEELRSGDLNDIKYRKTLVNIFVNRIYLYDDKFSIIFNVGKRKVTVNNILLKEIEANFKKESSSCMNKLGQPDLASLLGLAYFYAIRKK